MTETQIEHHKSRFSIREFLTFVLSFASSASLFSLVAYELLSGFNWISTGKPFHHKTCELTDTLLNTRYCSYAFSLSTINVNKIINWVLHTNIAVGFFIVIFSFAFLTSCVSPQPKD